MAADLSSSQSGEHGPISAINVTPFVDVVLVLLVIFMVTAPALMKDSIGLQLPKASTSDSQSLTSFGIAVTRQGQILLNGKLVSDGDLSAEVTKAIQTNPETQAIISADAEARHGDVVRAIDIIKTAGLNRFAVQIEREN